MSTDAPTFDPSDFSVAPRGRRVDKPWGYEVLLSPEDAPYTAKLIHVRAGQRLSLRHPELLTFLQQPQQHASLLPSLSRERARLHFAVQPQ